MIALAAARADSGGGVGLPAVRGGSFTGKSQVTRSVTSHGAPGPALTGVSDLTKGLLLYYQRQQRHVSCMGEVW